MNDGLIPDVGGDSPPPAGYLKLVNDAGVFRILDSNGKKYRLRPEPGTPVHASPATQILTLSGRAVAGETIAVGGVTYTWRASVTLPNEVKVGASTAAHDVLALVAAINASASTTLYGAGTVANPFFTAVDGSGDSVELTAIAYGPTASVANSEAMTNASFGSLTDGVFATEGQAGDQLYDSSFLYTANAVVTPTSTSGWEQSATAPLT